MTYIQERLAGMREVVDQMLADYHQRRSGQAEQAGTTEFVHNLLIQ